MRFLLAPGLAAVLATAALAAPPMQAVGEFEIDRTEVTIGQFRAYVAATGTVTLAERQGGGMTYEGGWQQRPGWVWNAPYGRPGADGEPIGDFVAQ